MPPPSAREQPSRGEKVPPNVKKNKASLGAAMLSTTSLLRVAVQLAAIPLLARVLGPYPYGILAIAMPIANTLASICDFGLSSTLVRHSSRKYEDTGFWIAASITSITLIGLVIASYTLHAFIHPDVGLALITLGLMLPLSCLMSIPIARLTRERRLGIIAFGDAIGFGLGLFAALICAFCDFGFWSLVIQQLVIICSRSSVYIYFSKFWPRMSADMRLARLLISEGARVTGSNLFETAAKTVDNMLTGILLGPRPAGAYTMAFQFARLPEMVFAGPLSMSLMGKTTAHSQAEPDVSEIYRSHLRGLAFIVFPAMAGLAAVADNFTEVILGPQWNGTESILRALCFAGAFLALGTVNQATLTSLGAYKDRLLVSTLLLLFVLCAIALGSLFNVIYLSYLVSLSYFFQFLIGAWAVSQRSMASAFTAIKEMSNSAFCSIFMFICISVFRQEFSSEHGPLFSLSLNILFGIMAYFLIYIALAGSRVLSELSNLRRIFSS